MADSKASTGPYFQEHAHPTQMDHIVADPSETVGRLSAIFLGSKSPPYSVRLYSPFAYGKYGKMQPPTVRTTLVLSDRPSPGSKQFRV